MTVDRTLVIGSEQSRALALKIVGALSLVKPWELTLREHHAKRSLEQNARLWKLHGLASGITGYSPEEMHELALCRYFGVQEIICGGVHREIPLKRSSQRNKKEFGEFMEATEAWYVSEFGVWLE